ncbi:MAG: 4-hydroxythreonine-4-phosphate dehydrogenase [Bacteroidota bacterium]|nr:MAG: 4-hydroxythreonine-4-phosphate dehydrogenase [Bacteroidetes bacterium OLB12]GIL23027.1 MAG: 4-hydroxythreonine-4-phosphate dehydrogenase [Bacteroidota bacterium]HNR74101.1 4-hydroxythreonine-4-phosphate dehydrogenase PdxA [Cyclobacteriaceae bacterium]
MSSASDKPRIGITIGDLNGIGAEVIIKALSDARLLNLFTPVVYGSAKVLSFYRKQMGLEDFNYSQVKSKGQYFHKSVNVVNCWEDVIEINPGQPSKQTAKAALLSLKRAVEDLKEGHLDGLVTGPIDKNTIHGEEFPYQGHTEYLTQEFGAGQSLMLMVGEGLRVGLVTEHIPVKDIPSFITKERVELKIRLMELSLKQDFMISKPKIAVLGLNPHAGDEGLLGKEEQEVIKPVINDLKTKGKLIFGPFAADGFFASGQHSKFDGVIAMYHDQGLVAFKTLSFESGINYTAGLPYVRTSPDHGTAYNLAGKNMASEGSMRQAMYVACEIIKNRAQQTIEI